jgi:hypothetical protein
VEITLAHEDHMISRPALVDSGSTINVLPYEDGLDLGLSWEAQHVPLKDEGFLQGAPAYGVLLTTQIAQFSSVKLAFAWTQKSRKEVRLILGQTNFFEYFEITFRGREKTFDISSYE